MGFAGFVRVMEYELTKKGNLRRKKGKLLALAPWPHVLDRVWPRDEVRVGGEGGGCMRWDSPTAARK